MNMRFLTLPLLCDNTQSFVYNLERLLDHLHIAYHPEELRMLFRWKFLGT